MKASINAIDTNPAALLEHALQAHQAIVNLAGVLDLGQHTPEKFHGMLSGLLGGAFDGTAAQGVIGDYNKARLDLSTVTAAKNIAVRTARDFAANAVDSLKYYFGRTWSPQWAGAGFSQGTLTVSGDPLVALNELQLHLMAFPAHEDAARGITAENTKAQITALSAAHQAWVEAKRIRKETASARRAALNELAKYLSGLREALKLVLQRDDPRWYDFGFKRPVDGMLPPVVEGVQLIPGVAGEVRVEWNPATRAINYRVTVLNPDGEEVASQLTPETMVVLEALPRGVELTFNVTALNGAGENQPATATLTLV